MKATGKTSGFMISEIIPELVVAPFLAQEQQSLKRKASTSKLATEHEFDENEDEDEDEISFKYDDVEVDTNEKMQKYESFDESPIQSDEDEQVMGDLKKSHKTSSSSSTSSSPPRASSSPFNAHSNYVKKLKKDESTMKMHKSAKKVVHVKSKIPAVNQSMTGPKSPLDQQMDMLQLQRMLFQKQLKDEQDLLMLNQNKNNYRFDAKKHFSHSTIRVVKFFI